MIRCQGAWGVDLRCPLLDGHSEPCAPEEHKTTVERGVGSTTYGVVCSCGYSTGYGLRERKARLLMHRHIGHELTTSAVRAPGYGFAGGWGLDVSCSCGEFRGDPVSHEMSAVLWHEDHLREVKP